MSRSRCGARRHGGRNRARPRAVAAGARQQVQPPYHGVDPDDARRPRCRSCAPENGRRSGRHARARHLQQLAPAATRPGALISRRRRTSTATSGPTPRRPMARRSSTAWRRRGQELRAQPCPGQLVQLGPVRVAVQRRFMSRTSPIGWIVEIDPTDPASVPVTYSARPLQPRGRRMHHQHRWPRGALFRRRLALRVHLSLCKPRALSREGSRTQYAPAVGGDALGRALQRRRHRLTGCRSCSARGRRRPPTASIRKPTW